MKVLVFYTKKFAYKTAEQNLSNEELNIFYPDIKEINHQGEYSNCITAFIQVEKEDEEKGVKSREKKLANHLKWVARKNNTHSILLHSFAHLSSSKASLKFTADLLKAACTRLQNGDYEASITPFGFFLDINMEAPGFSMARVWGDL
ncbi:threonyl-tRNA synthetase editing domain-containing protein [Thermophagus xiamenensis]|uniref:Editing domain of threonyl-tRNA synthetase n=1 Tax=Thermophagus xiamenensis TaxID=385682 RepID=A0A1I1XNV0_9BACT|nr:threonyl-tRNA synthetase editing domain-containing protein [Thermophagus xiamenensis]SFE08977.1 editing domain of threonyl-tRNA synthetase [Thermophagus xiamenensis]